MEEHSHFSCNKFAPKLKQWQTKSKRTKWSILETVFSVCFESVKACKLSYCGMLGRREPLKSLLVCILPFFVLWSWLPYIYMSIFRTEIFFFWTYFSASFLFFKINITITVKRNKYSWVVTLLWNRCNYLKQFFRNGYSSRLSDMPLMTINVQWLFMIKTITQTHWELCLCCYSKW